MSYEINEIPKSVKYLKVTITLNSKTYDLETNTFWYQIMNVRKREHYLKSSITPQISYMCLAVDGVMDIVNSLDHTQIDSIKLSYE